MYLAIYFTQLHIDSMEILSCTLGSRQPSAKDNLQLHEPFVKDRDQLI